MSRLSLILFIIIFLLLGYILYKLKHREFTDNTKFILNLLFSELDGIYKELKIGELSNFEKKLLITRKEEILFILEQFFGKNLKEEENELV